MRLLRPLVKGSCPVISSIWLHLSLIDCRMPQRTNAGRAASAPRELMFSVGEGKTRGKIMAYLSAQLSFDIKSFVVYIVTESTCTCRIKLPGKSERGTNRDLTEGDNVEAAIKASVGSGGLE